MTRIGRWIGFSLLSAAHLAFAADPPALSTTECEVFHRERDFAASVDAHDAKAFASFLHPAAVFGAASPQPVRGRDAIVASWSDIIQARGVQLQWRPQFVSIGTDTHVAMSRGPYVLTSKSEQGETRYAIGMFVSVWVRRDAASPWRVMLDGGGPPPTPATEAQARQHLGSAPAGC